MTKLKVTYGKEEVEEVKFEHLGENFVWIELKLKNGKKVQLGSFREEV